MNSRPSLDARESVAVPAFYFGKRSNHFKTFIVSGGGIEFMRPWAAKTYGIPPEQVVGSA